MNWFQIILFLIKNFSTIKGIIKEIIDLINQLSGDKDKDEKTAVRRVRWRAKKLADMFGVACPPDLVKE